MNRTVIVAERVEKEAVTLAFFERMGAISKETAADERYIKANRAVGVWLDKLMASLSDDQREWLIEYESAVAEADSVMAEHSYRQGLADGIAMMASRRRSQ